MTQINLQILNELPEGLLELPAPELNQLLAGPTLIHLNRGVGSVLCIAVLLHGNETSGWNALRRWLSTEPIDRELIVFIGNIAAAAQAQRTLPRQHDYNRIWRNGNHPEAELAKRVLDYLAQHTLLLCVDMHNNTGRNPHYAVITDQQPATLGLAALFSERAVLVEEPDSVFSRAVAEFCPSIAVELGPIGDPASDQRAYELLQRLSETHQRPSLPFQPITQYQALGRVHINSAITFDFADNPLEGTDLTLTAGIEAVNFHELPIGTVFGSTNRPLSEVIRVVDPEHHDITSRYFRLEGKRIVLNHPVIPAMYTTDPSVILQDCLCYFMTELPESPTSH